MNAKKTHLCILAIAVFALGCSGEAGTVTTPPIAPPTYTAPLPWVYSQSFSATSPFHVTVDALKSSGAKVLPATAMSALWQQGAANQDLSTASWMFPVYVGLSTDPVKTFTCTKWGACNANGMQVHVPAGALPEAQPDGHIGIIDTANNVEVDGWQCTVSTATVACSWGAQYPLGGSGLENIGSNAVHAGYSAGLFVISAQELANGKIDHALGLLAHCLNDPTVYPADQQSGTDASCGPTGAPSYGNLLHLLWTPSQISASSYSPECKTVLTALATYGAYASDTGNGGLAFVTQHPYSYTALNKPNPWQTTILPDLTAAGDASGTYWQSCLNRLKPTDLELLQIPVGNY